MEIVRKGMSSKYGSTVRKEYERRGIEKEKENWLLKKLLLPMKSPEKRQIYKNL